MKVIIFLMFFVSQSLWAANFSSLSTEKKSIIVAEIVNWLIQPGVDFCLLQSRKDSIFRGPSSLRPSGSNYLLVQEGFSRKLHLVDNLSRDWGDKGEMILGRMPRLSTSTHREESPTINKNKLIKQEKAKLIRDDRVYLLAVKFLDPKEFNSDYENKIVDIVSKIPMIVQVEGVHLAEVNLPNATISTGEISEAFADIVNAAMVVSPNDNDHNSQALILSANEVEELRNISRGKAQNLSTELAQLVEISLNARK